MEGLAQKVREAVTRFCQTKAEQEQRGYAQAAWFEQNGLELIQAMLENQNYVDYLRKAEELGYVLDDVEVKPYASTHGPWHTWTSFRLEIPVYGGYSPSDKIVFAKDSELPKAFVFPFLEQERQEREEAYDKKQAEIAERDRLEAEAKAAAIAEKTAWIAEHGSDYLKRATKLGYNCQRQYVTERAELELPDYSVDFDDNADWNDRACPSMDALEEVEKLIAAGLNAEVVWLTSPTHRSESYEDEANWENCEAIVIRDYIGKYDLVKEI